MRTDNIIKQPPLPDTIHFNHTMENAKTEVMRITRDGVWVNPDMQVDETAKAVLDALDYQVKVLVQRAVEEEREACAKIVEADGRARGGEGLVLIKAAGRIRARGEAEYGRSEKPPVKSYAGGKPNYCTPLQSDRMRIDPVTGDVGIGTVDAVNISQERVDETAKGEHEPTVKWDASAPLVITQHPAFQQPKREWVGLTPTEFNGIKDTATTIGYAITKTEAMLKQKNNG